VTLAASAFSPVGESEPKLPVIRGLMLETTEAVEAVLRERGVIQ
jgi:hypothetical protein